MSHLACSTRASSVRRVAAVVVACLTLAACTNGADVGGSADSSEQAAVDTVITVAGLAAEEVLNAATVTTTTITITAEAAPDTVVVTLDGAELDASTAGVTGLVAEPAAAAAEEPAATQLPDDEPSEGATTRATPTSTSSAPAVDPDGPTVVTIDGDHLATLADGEHVLEVTAGEDTLFRNPSTVQHAFAVDATPPELTLPETIEASDLVEPLEVSFDVVGADEVESAAGTVTLSGESGTVAYEAPPAEVALVAHDAAGNTTEAVVPVIVAYPGARAVHTTPLAWQYEPKKTAIVELIEAGLVDAVQLDVKDEAGDIGFDSDVELANESGADAMNDNFDAAAAVREIHDLGARVIGRLVVYKDTKLAQWAWNNGRRDMVTQTTGGQPFTGSYGEFAFTNPANPDVQQYNLEIALEAAELGFDDILYDYIRRPDGALDAMVFPGIGDRTPEEAVIEVMADAYPLLREQGVWVGASVFGIAVTRPLEIAQDIPGMAPYVDYISPMVYPNHWGPGEYDLASPVDAPYEIVQRSLADYQELLAPTNTVVMPWLQDFGGYGESQVRAQIEATVDATGEQWFLLWNSGANYTRSALDPIGPDGP
jgi:hypothetical protein